jgi:hypothetical protein
MPSEYPEHTLPSTLRSPRHKKIMTTREAAEQFMEMCGLEPTPDSVNQLIEAFLPALRIMCERGYDPNGDTWIRKGWRGLVCDILGKAGRIRYRSWLQNKFDRDSAMDLINFAGFYVRLENQGAPWGDWGGPAQWSENGHSATTNETPAAFAGIDPLVILAARHLDPAEGVMHAGRMVTTDDEAAIRTVLNYISRTYGMEG